MRIQRKAVMLFAASSMLMSVALSAPTALAEPPGGETDTPAITQTVTPSGPQQPGDQPSAPSSEQPSTTAPDSQDQTEPSTPGEEPSTSTPSSEAPGTSEAPSTSAPPAQAPGKRLAPAAVTAGCQTYPPTTFQVCGRIKDKYNQTGGPLGFLLLPKSNELTNPGNTGKRTEFLGGNIYWSAATDAHPVAHEFLTKWGEKGYEGGYLKYPTTDEIVLPGTVNNRRQEYQGGSIYWAAGIGAHTINGAIKDKWLALGGYTGALGYPTSDEKVTPGGVGRYNTFQHGSIYWSPTTGAHAVDGEILTRWALAGFEQSEYGYPTGDVGPGSDPGSRIQTFQNGTIYTSAGLFQGVIVPASGGPTIFPSDATYHPEFPTTAEAVDRSCYNSKNNWSDDALATRAALTEAAGPVRLYLTGYQPAAALWENYQDIDNGPPTYQFDSQTVKNWMSSSFTGYPGLAPPASVKSVVREAAIQEAIAKAGQAGKAVKVVRSSPWKLVGSDSVNNKAYFYATGKHQMSTSVAVIAKPIANGKFSLNIDQGTAMWDVYDFHVDDEIPTPAEAGSLIGEEMCNYGVAAPFLSFGEGATETSSEVR